MKNSAASCRVSHGNTLYIPHTLTLSHQGEGIIGNPTASGWGIKKLN